MLYPEVESPTELASTEGRSLGVSMATGAELSATLSFSSGCGWLIVAVLLELVPLSLPLIWPY